MVSNGKDLVLVVNDERVVQDFLRETLEHFFNATVDAAFTGDMAIEKILRTKYQLVLTDLLHLGPNGLEIARVSHQSVLNADTPIGLVTAASISLLIERMGAEIANNFTFVYQHPIAIEEFVRQVGRHLRISFYEKRLYHAEQAQRENRRPGKRGSPFVQSSSSEEPYQTLKEFDESLREWFYRCEGD
jgi:CheY-like chemotaxis protein